MNDQLMAMMGNWAIAERVQYSISTLQASKPNSVLV
jgi:hypothetical protein